MRFIKALTIGTVSISIVLAQIPETMSYQAVLKDESGALIPSGNYLMTFSLYAGESGADALWTETHESVEVSQGVFTVILGTIAPFELAFDSQYYLGVKLGTGEEMTPRIPMTSVPYSMTSHSANKAGSILGVSNVFPSEGNVGIGSLSPASKLQVMGDVTVEGNVSADSLSLSCTVSAQSFEGDGSGLTNLTAWTVTDSSVTSEKIQDGTIQRVDVVSTFKAPYADTSDHAVAAVPVGSAGGDLSGTYPDPTIADSSVTGSKILDGTITGSDIDTSAALNVASLTTTANVGIGTTSPNEILTIEGALSLDEITAPSHSGGYGKVYVKSSDGRLYFKDDGGTEYDLTAAAISGVGEINTASNVGTGGVGVFKQKTGVDLEFKTVNTGSDKVTVIDDATNSEIDIDVDETNLTLDSLGGTLSVAKGGTGAPTASAARANLGLVIGSDVEPYDTDLDSIAALAKTDGNFIVGNGTAWVAESGATARSSLGLGTLATQDSNSVTISGGSISGIKDLAVRDGGTGASTASTARKKLGVVIGSDVQPYDTDLDSIAALAKTDGIFIVGNGTGWVAESGDTARSSLGLGSLATQDTSDVDIDGGAIDGVTIGADNSAPGTFSSLQTGSDGTDGQFTLYSEQGATDYLVVLKPNAAMTQTTTYTFPEDDGTADQVLTTDGSGALSWTIAAVGNIAAVGDATSGDAFTADGTGNTLYFEGTDANTSEIALVGENPSSDVTVTIPATTGTLYIAEGTDVAVADGGTGASTAAAARANLGLAIGSDVQGYDADLDAIAGLAKTDGNLIVGDGTAWVVENGGTARSSLGLGSMATQNSGSVSISGGSISGITDLAVVDGGTGASTGSAARENLGVVIGSDVQAHDADLDAIAGLAKTDGNFIVGDGTVWVVESDGTARSSLGLGSLATQNSGSVSISGGSISGIKDLAVADGGTGASTAAPARANLGLVIGSDVQPYDTDLDSIAALAKTDGNFIVGNDTAWVAESGATARSSLGLGSMATQDSGSVSISGGSISGIRDLAVADGGTGASTVSAARNNLGVAIGSNVQAHDADLDAIAGLAKTDGNFIVGNGTGWVAESGGTVRASLGLGSLATQNSNSVSISGGSISGITDLAIADGGTGASTASAARNNLGVAIGSDVQAHDSDLGAIAVLVSADGSFLVGNGTTWVAESGGTARSSLGLGSLASQDSGSVSISGGSISGITDLAIADGGTGASTGTAARDNLGVAIGSDVQAYDGDLASIAALAKSDGNFIVGNGSGWVAESGGTVRASLGLGSLATQNSSSVWISGGSISGITDLAVADGGTGASSLTSNYLVKGNGTSALSSSLVYDNGSSVGIGTANPYPVAQLHVAYNPFSGSITDLNGSTRLLVQGQNNDNSYITVLSDDDEAASSYAGVIFGDESDASRGGVGYNNRNDYLAFYTGDFSERMKIASNGDVTGTYGDYHVASDERMKRNIQALDNVLGKILQLRGVSFEWKKPTSPAMNHTHYGLIAQEVAEVLPELVNTNEEGLKAIEWWQLNGIYVEAIKEQQSQIEELKAQIKALTVQVNRIGESWE